MKTFLSSLALLVIAGIVSTVMYYLWHPDRIPQGHETPPSAQIVATTTSSSGLAIEIITTDESSTTTPSISIEYPQFPTLGTELNQTIRSSVENRLADFRKYSAENDEARRMTAPKGAPLPPNGYSFIAKWQPTQINKRYISFIIRFDSYVGGANENQEIETYNYDISTSKFMDLSEVFATSTDYLRKISSEARRQLTDIIGKNNDTIDPLDSMTVGTEPTVENFKYFTFTDYLVQIYFPKYSVAPGAYGELVVKIPRKL